MGRALLRSCLFGLTGLALLVLGWPGSAPAINPHQFDNAIDVIRDVAYNPRPIATDTADVTGVSESTTRSDFLAAFTRVTIAAPANGSTPASADPLNAPDLTLVGYERIHPGAPGSRPAVVLSHGGFGQGSIALQQAFLVHLALVLYDNGYDILAVDTRSGLLTRGAYTGNPAVPDAARSVAWLVGGSAIEFCDTLPTGFRNTSHSPISRPSSFGAFEAGDLRAAAAYFKAKTGATTLGVLSGSRGGLALLRAAALQAGGLQAAGLQAQLPGAGVTGILSALLDAILVLSPVGQDSTDAIASSNTAFSCARALAAQHYAGVAGTGLGDFALDPDGTVTTFYSLLDGVAAIAGIQIPTLTLHTLSDDQVFANTTFAYQQTTEGMPLARSLVMTRIGHFHEIWQSDPYWMDRVALVFFKRTLAPGNASVTAAPGFLPLGSSTTNQLLVHARFGSAALSKLLSSDSIATYLGNDVCFP